MLKPCHGAWDMSLVKIISRRLPEKSEREKYKGEIWD